MTLRASVQIWTSISHEDRLDFRPNIRVWTHHTTVKSKKSPCHELRQRELTHKGWHTL
jgi:hypothetical protein